MHELSLAEAITNTIKELCSNSNWKRVRRVVLKVGHMRQVDPELLVFAFDVTSKGTLAEGAEVSILQIPNVLKCNTCGQTTAPETAVFLCQSCGSMDVELLSGMELMIDSLEVENEQTS